MKAKDKANMLYWTFILVALVDAHPELEATSCNCSGYGIKGVSNKYCVDELLDFTWEDTPSLMDVVETDKSSLAPIIEFIGKWATCSFMESMDKTIPIVQTCPSNFDGSIELKEKCEVQDNSFPPVDYNGVLTVTFRNIFCARCHGITKDLMFRLNSWFSNFTCSGQINSFRDSCRVQYDPPATRLYICYLEPLKAITQSILVPGCKANDTKACHILDFVIYHMEQFNNVCGGLTEIGTDLTTLFRFPTQQVRKITINGQTLKESSACKEDESFDQFLLTCEFVCPPGYFPKLGECRNNLTRYLNADTQPFPIAKNLLSLNISIELNAFSNKDIVGIILDRVNKTYPKEWITSISRYSTNTWRLKGALVIFNLTESFLEEFVNMLPVLTVDVELNIESIEFRVKNNVLKNNISCPKASYALRCTDNAEVDFQKDTYVARIESNNQSVFVPLENTYFEVQTTSLKPAMVISSVCFCEQLPVKLDVICSVRLFKFTANEYTVNILDGTLEILSNGIKVDNSSFDIDIDGNAFVCLESLSLLASFQPFLNYDATISYFSWTCSLISVSFQLATIVLFALFSELRNLSSKITIGLSVTMILGQIGLHMPRISLEFCQGTAFITHFNWLSAFAWMTSQAVNMFVTFHPKTQSKATGWHDDKAFSKYALVCLLIPLVTVSVFFTLDMIPGEHMHSGYGQATCGWFANQSSYIYAFFVPVGLSVLLNIVFFSLTLYHIEKTLTNTSKVTGKARNRNMCIIYIKLTSIMGLSWVFGFIASVVNNRGLWFVYIILNGLQGVFIFISFSVNASVRKMIKSKMKGSSNRPSQTKESTIAN